MNKSIANSQDNITAGTYTAQSYGETETTLVRFVRLYQGAFVAGVDVVLVGIMAILAWSLLRARKAQQEAQAASRAKTAFLSRMSHDIRTPLMLCPFCVRLLLTYCLLRLLVMTFVGILLTFVPFGITEAYLV